MQKAKLAVVTLLISVCLSGCVKESDISEKYLNDATQLLENNIDESFEYKSCKVLDKKEDHVLYYYTLNNRELEFSVETYEDNGRVFYTSYYDKIKALYHDDVIEYLNNAGIGFVTSDTSIKINDISDTIFVDKIVSSLNSANLLYAKENMYHESDSFTYEHPLFDVTLVDRDGEEFMTVAIDGLSAPEDMAYDMTVLYYSKHPAEVPDEENN